MDGLRQFLRTRLSSKGKQVVTGAIAGHTAGGLIRRFSGGTVRHRGAQIIVNDPRVPNHMVGALFWQIYERAEADQIAHHLPSDRDVVELGASSGVNTMLIAGLLQPGRRVIAVEADPDLCALARRNCALNGVEGKVDLVSAAIHYGTDTAYFSRGAGPVNGRVRTMADAASADQFAVSTLGLSDLVQKNGLSDFTLVMDIEGAEWGIIQRPEELRGCDTIIAELHDTYDADGRRVLVSEMLDKLVGQGFRIVESYGVCIVAKRQPAH